MRDVSPQQRLQNFRSARRPTWLHPGKVPPAVDREVDRSSCPWRWAHLCQADAQHLSSGSSALASKLHVCEILALQKKRNALKTAAKVAAAADMCLKQKTPLGPGAPRPLAYLYAHPSELLPAVAANSSPSFGRPSSLCGLGPSANAESCSCGAPRLRSDCQEVVATSALRGPASWQGGCTSYAADADDRSDNSRRVLSLADVVHRRRPHDDGKRDGSRADRGSLVSEVSRVSGSTSLTSTTLGGGSPTVSSIHLASADGSLLHGRTSSLPARARSRS